MIKNGRLVASGSVVEADICVIGSGPAGMTLALQLAKLTGQRIVLVESGGLGHHEHDLARGTVKGQTYFPLHETRIRRVGGSSWSWGGVLCTLDFMDFQQRDWVANSGWPIGYDAVAAYYPAALRILGGELPSEESLLHASSPATSACRPSRLLLDQPQAVRPRFPGRTVEQYAHRSLYGYNGPRSGAW